MIVAKLNLLDTTFYVKYLQLCSQHYLSVDQYEEAARKNIEASITILNKGLSDFKTVNVDIRERTVYHSYNT